MSERKTLSVQRRADSGKGPNRRLRDGSMIPGVFYSAIGENIPVQADAKTLNKVYSEVGRTTVFDLVVSDSGKESSHPVLFWQLQRDPCKSAITHVDFYGVDLDKPVKVTVPLVFAGVARGTKVGGTLETYREEVVLVAKPLDMPARITVDISDLDIGKTVQVADLKLPEGVQASYDVNYAIVAVVTTSTEDEGEGGEAAASA